MTSHDLTPGWNGAKVRLVQEHLGTFTHGNRATMNPETIEAVRQWQRDRDLDPTGVVDEPLWQAMDLGHDWSLDTWLEEPRLGPDATASERIDVMVNYCLEQQGAPYTWGAAGPRQLGFDCSGLTLQSMVVAGIDPLITPEQHAAAGWLTTHHFYEHPDLVQLPLASIQRGDWVFYTDRDQVIRHIAAYLGDGTIIHAVDEGVVLEPLVAVRKNCRFIAPLVFRPATEQG